MSLSFDVTMLCMNDINDGDFIKIDLYIIKLKKKSRIFAVRFGLLKLDNLILQSVEINCLNGLNFNQNKKSLYIVGVNR